MDKQSPAIPATRFPTKETAEVEVYGRTGVYDTLVKNLSKTGACVQSKIQQSGLLIGDVVQLKVNLHNLNRYHIMNGQIVWKNGLELGIHFIPSDKIFEYLAEKK